MIRAKKHLGQNFLNSKKFIGDVVRAATLTKDDVVLEIGPGKGALTEPLLEAAGHVVAIEKDPELFEYLKDKFAVEISEKRLTLICDDATAVDIKSLVGETYVLVANIPYYITGMILRHFLSQDLQPSRATLIVQKEVAERVASNNGKESVLSLSVNTYGTPKVVEKIPARYFSPKPNVDSAILSIENISKSFFDDISEDEFFTIVKVGFGQKRKKLSNNLSTLYSKERVTTTFSRCGVSENSRAEELSRELWKCLVKNVSVD